MARPEIGSELVSIAVGGQLYAIDIMSVREIRGWTASTPLPHAPPHVLGMINLRGAILPVVDLSARLGLGRSAPTGSSVVVVAQINDRQVGLVVEAVCDILTVEEGMLQDPPDTGSAEVRDFVQGVMSTDEGIVSVLVLDQVLPTDLKTAA